MLTIEGGWDWFHSEEARTERLEGPEQEAFKEGRICAWTRSDGDRKSAIIAAVRGVNAPPENTRFVIIDPMIGDNLLVVAWDDRTINLVQSENDEASEWLFDYELDI